MQVNGRIAVVTGAGSGMGRELVRQLAAQGCHVAACDIAERGLTETRELCAEYDVRVTTHLVDVADESQLQNFAAEVREQHDTDHIHLLFNNAGIGGGGSIITDSRESWERTFSIDWGGVYLGVRTFLPMLIAADEARIVNTSSVNGFWASLGPTTPHTAYGAAKFAVKGFTEALITDLRVNAPHVSAAVVMPGHIGTAIVSNSRKVATGVDSDQLSPSEIADVRGRMSVLGEDIESLSDDEIQALVADRARHFEEKAPTTAAEAAGIILDGVRRDKWRILVGEDAVGLDEHVRRDPENAYTPEFHAMLQEDIRWGLGGQ
ncbi:SDR family NAD(P)-dependent oxidoreductase [Cumulibacter soli]|uniref:SDR family NAD(P)-dependent oxidoreductase n=1 Tax=Cumulibacter soli TaxID=2546344 RepID=UPI0010684C27|nr:SDR family NAD(P)-dependent oxidoreductase [Cumulibacter soli]